MAPAAVYLEPLVAGASPTTSSFTGAVLFLPMPICVAAALDMSMTRPACFGPRSLILTSTVLLFFVLVTFTFVPNARDGCAAVSLLWLNTSPLAVLWPWSLSEYTAARPSMLSPDFAAAGSDGGGVTGSGLVGGVAWLCASNMPARASPSDRASVRS